jgi:glycosyltransferase involved in cell wall biosynthesis
LVFYLQGARVPATRVRGVAIANLLSGAGVACDLRIPRPSVYGDVAWRAFPQWLRPLLQPLSVAHRIAQLRGLRPDDVVFLQRPLTEWPLTSLERRAARGRHSIFDFDDAIYLNHFGRAKLRKIVGAVDHVIAGNSTLAEAANAPDRTTVIPTALDLARFQPRAPSPREGSSVVIGWTGLSCNYDHLAHAQAGIARAIEVTGARFVVISDKPPTAALRRALRAEFVPWRPQTEIDDLAAIDVGVMPLPDTPRTRGKCGFKLLQYMALARPGVASPVGVNADIVSEGRNGYLARSDAEWTDALVALVRDASLRERIGREGRRTVESGYSLDAVLPRYLELLRRLAPDLVPAATPRAAASPR